MRPCSVPWPAIEQRPDSDIDILVDLDPVIVATMFDYAGLKDYVASLFRGSVDVIDREALKPRTFGPVRRLTRSMLSDIERDALEDIRDNIARAMRFVDGLDLDGFLGDDKTFYAATRCLEIISRSVSTVDACVQSAVSGNPMEGRSRFRQHLPA